MRLNDLLPTTYKYKDEELPIDLSFDNVLDVLDILILDDVHMVHIAELSLDLLFGPRVIDEQDYIDVWNDVFDAFIDSSKDEHVEYDLAGKPMPKRKEKQVISLSEDAEFIYASFLQAYQMDLFEQQTKLHWFKFKSLLSGLPENTVIKQIMRIRSYEPSEHDSREYKDEMKRLQEIYSIEEKEVDE